MHEFTQQLTFKGVQAITLPAFSGNHSRKHRVNLAHLVNPGKKLSSQSVQFHIAGDSGFKVGVQVRANCLLYFLLSRIYFLIAYPR
jgi:hypothetical protein